MYEIEITKKVQDPQRAEQRGDCLIWKQRRTRGVPTVTWRGKVYSARAVAAVNAGIELDAGQVVGTSCGEPMCLAPAHLIAVSPGRRVRDSPRELADELALVWARFGGEPDELPEGPDGHLLWDGYMTGPSGTLPVHSGARGSISVRRLLYEARIAGLEPGEVVVSMCGEIRCVNPMHCEITRLRRPQRETETAYEVLARWLGVELPNRAKGRNRNHIEWPGPLIRGVPVMPRMSEHARTAGLEPVKGSPRRIALSLREEVPERARIVNTCGRAHCLHPAHLARG